MCINTVFYIRICDRNDENKLEKKVEMDRENFVCAGGKFVHGKKGEKHKLLLWRRQGIYDGAPFFALSYIIMLM